MATKLILVRHGESEANAEHRFTGQSNRYGLTERGHAQAELTAVLLQDTKIDAIYASDLRRAYETTVHIANKHGMTITEHIGMREIYAGKWEGERFEDLPTLYPDDFSVWKNDIGRAVPTGGESVAALKERVNAAIEEIVRANPGRTVCIGTHATPIRVMQCIWEGRSLDEMKDVPFVPNASVTTVFYEEDLSFHDPCIGQSEHLGVLSTRLPKMV